MTCAPYIAPAPAVLGRDETVAQAVSTLAYYHFQPLAVVDGDGHLLGLFGPRELAALLLPMGARLAGDGFALGFVSESPEILRERLEAVGTDPVGKYATAHTPLQPTTSLDEALLRMHRGATVQIAVDAKGKVVGVLNAAAVLAPLVGG